MRTAPYGSWLSPITSELITRSSIRIGSVAVDGSDVYWLESRPLESGRNVIVRKSKDGTVCDITPKPYNARTLAQEYGGTPFSVYKGIVYFVNYDDQRIYRIKPGTQPEPLTKKEEVRYADMFVDEKLQRLICIQEDHSVPGQEPVTTIASVSLKDGAAEMLIAGNDFYAAPALSPGAPYMSWMSWNHPNMPWDESCVWAANVGADGFPSNMRLVAGGNGESVFQPQWSPDGQLYYVSDRNGWWNIYRHTDYEGEQEICAREAEFGFPFWVFGMSTFAFQSADTIICTYGQSGVWKLAALDVNNGALKDFDLPFNMFESVRANSTHAYFMAGSPTLPTCLVELDLSTGKYTILKKSNDLPVDAGYVSEAQPIEFPTTAGRTAYAFFYPPRNKDFNAPDGELPPLVVHSHGGPTAASTSTFNLGTQYWTSRGFAVVDVNYGGSTGFGREYRSRLYNSWGVVDVDDCINAAKYLADKGLVDGNRLAISGGSAGGYTTLCALTFHDVFKAGASHFGVSDLEALAKDTHKFESHYLDRLVGPYPLARQLYEERSPIHHVDKLNCPVIFLQGLEDKVVPPDQSEKMVNALKKRGVPVAYVTFEGEQHGFRKAENIRRSLDAELYFYSRIFKFELPEAIEPVPIDNLEQAAAKR